MVILEDLLKIIRAYNPEEEEIITKAYYFAEKYHHEEKRLSGEDYITHPLSVAIIAANDFADRDMVIACICHDLVENTPVTLEQIAILFGESVANLVGGVTELGEENFLSKEEERLANEEKILLSLDNDVRIAIIKIYDRLHNMMTMKHQLPGKKEAKSEETLNVYAPLTSSFGMSVIKELLEYFSFEILEPEKFAKVLTDVDKILHKKRQIINNVLETIRENLVNNGINKFALKLKIKSAREIFDELKSDVQLAYIDDLISIRVIVDDHDTCYDVLKLMHSLFTPYPKKFKDYIATPRPNMYQALHTTVFDGNGGTIKIKIKTFTMEEIASFGLARYWNVWKGEAYQKMTEDIKKKIPILSIIYQT